MCAQSATEYLVVAANQRFLVKNRISLLALKSNKLVKSRSTIDITFNTISFLAN